jgi:hypothetical protein
MHGYPPADRFDCSSDITGVLGFWRRSADSPAWIPASTVSFTRERHGQLFPANPIQTRRIVARKFPPHVWRNAIVAMPKDVAAPAAFDHGVPVRRPFASDKLSDMN